MRPVKTFEQLELRSLSKGLGSGNYVIVDYLRRGGAQLMYGQDKNTSLTFDNIRTNSFYVMKYLGARVSAAASQH